MLVFLIKSSLIIAVLFVFYKTLLERESFFTANRIYLLACLALTFILPFISLPKLVQDQGFIAKTLVQVDDRPTISLTQETGSAQQSSATTVNPPQNSSPNTDQYVVHSERGLYYWITLIYFFGVIILSLTLFIQIVSLLILVFRATEKIKDTGYVIVSSSRIKEPCSFFKYVFINPENYDYDTYEQIIAHERIHVRKWHSIDLLLSEIAIILLWFNPFIWFFRKEVEKNIEYETDNLLVERESVKKKSYQMNLLKIAALQKPLAITTNYNQSLIKKRILKMSTKKSNPHNYWKYAFIAPIVLVMLLSMNTPLEAIPSKYNPVAVPQHEENGNKAVGTKDCRELLRAVKDQNVSLVKQLLETVDPDCMYNKNGEPRTPLVAAARSGDLQIGKLLVEANADIEYHHDSDESPLMAASENGHIEFVTYLMEQGADVNRKVSGDGTALLVASREGHLEIAKYLISKNADVNGQVSGDGTPLICAAKRGHYEVAKLLLENNADPYLASPGDEYPMYHARMAKDKRMIALLKQYESD